MADFPTKVFYDGGRTYVEIPCDVLGLDEDDHPIFVDKEVYEMTGIERLRDICADIAYYEERMFPLLNDYGEIPSCGFVCSVKGREIAYSRECNSTYEEQRDNPDADKDHTCFLAFSDWDETCQEKLAAQTTA